MELKLKATDLDFYCTQSEIIDLLAKVSEVFYNKGKIDAGAPKYITQNKAYRHFEKSRVKNWVSDGLISGKPNGKGKTSTVYYEYSKLLELDASEKIKIRKPYIN
ncbi:MAG: hypothetical protein LBJ63_06280 [Prevotellaceae bacterium]|jgi:hypothetical protein|nr:hypothetical protein [Prevotellaceae bacterium]